MNFHIAISEDNLLTSDNPVIALDKVEPNNVKLFQYILINSRG